MVRFYDYRIAAKYRLFIGILALSAVLLGGVKISKAEVRAAERLDYSLVFDPMYYVSHHADVRNALGNDPQTLLAHFIEYGMKEGRQASERFSAQAYRDRYPDLRKAFGNDMEKYYIHYMTYGCKEGRIATPAVAEQKITVKGTGGSNAKLSFSERDASGIWHTLITSKAYIGMNGFSSDRKEGDGTTPTGTYDLTMAFGIAADPGCALGYTKVDDNDYWCGDPSSPYYNRFVSADQVGEFDRSASEHLIKVTKQYQYCLNIGFNKEQTPGRGSAIFLHCYGPNSYTHGCVAIPKADMLFILTHINDTCRITLSR